MYSRVVQCAALLFASVASFSPFPIERLLSRLSLPKLVLLRSKRTWSDHDPVEVAKNYIPAEFRSVWYGFSGDLHTILSSDEVDKIFGKKKRVLKYRRERFETPDNDFFDVDFYNPRNESPSEVQKIAIITHGLESSTDYKITINMAMAFSSKGFIVAAMCFRGCSGEDNRTLRQYHLGFTDDLDLLVRKLNDQYPNSSFFLSGFSLGGNVICKYLGQLGDDAKKYRISGASVCCVPFDAVSCQKQLDSGLRRVIYSKNFLQSMIPKIVRKYNHMAPNDQARSGLDIEKIKKCKTIGMFDDLVVAKIFGFNSNIDYYLKSQSKSFLKHIRVPVLAIQALDDPFMPSSRLPTEETCGGAPVKLAYYKKGGHCAFASREKKHRNVGWLPEQLSSFADYVIGFSGPAVNE